MQMTLLLHCKGSVLFRLTLLLQLFVLRIAPLQDATNLIVGSLILFHANHVSVNGSLVLLNTKPLSNSVPTLLPTNFSRQLLLLFCPIDAFDGLPFLGSINSPLDAASTPAIFTFL